MDKMITGDRRMDRKKPLKSISNISPCLCPTVYSTMIWNRKFDLPVRFDCFGDEKILKSQYEIFDRFSLNSQWIEEARSDIERYCSKLVREDKDNRQKKNVFSYLKPDYIYVNRDELKPRIALMFKYRYDPDHGVAAVFDEQGHFEIGSQDIIL